MVIVRSESSSVDLDVAELALDNDILVAATPKGTPFIQESGNRVSINTFFYFLNLFSQISLTPVAMQSDETMLTFTKKLLEKIPSDRGNPGIAMLDGHFSHLSKEVQIYIYIFGNSCYCLINKVTSAFSNSSCYLLCEESQTSQDNQALDNEVMATVDIIYRQNYQAGVEVNLRKRIAAVTNLDRFSYLVKTILQLKLMKCVSYCL